MNKNIEIQKIKVNNGQELINKAKEYKKSGGEWKLLENYFISPIKKQEKGWSLKNNSEGIKISNGEQEVDIYFEGLRGRIDFNLTDEWKEIKQIFPEISQTVFGEDPFSSFGKEEKRGEEKITISRSLNAWSIWDISKIICDFVKENKAEIKKSVASLGYDESFKHWVKFGNDTDGNIFIWLGKRDEENIDINGGGELQISINRKDLEKYTTSYGHEAEGRKVFWKDLDNQQLANELRKMRINPFWGLVISGGKDGAISGYNNHKVGFTKTPDSDLDLPDREIYSPKKDNDNQSPKSGNKNNQLTNTEKTQIRQWLLKKGISKISLENGKLVIEYDNKTILKIETEDSEQKKYHQIIQKLPNQSLSLTELQNNTTNPSPNSGNNSLYKGLAIGAGGVSLIMIIVYCWVRKNQKKKKE